MKKCKICGGTGDSLDKTHICEACDGTGEEYSFYTDEQLQRFLDLYPLHMDIGKLVEECRQYKELLKQKETLTQRASSLI